MELIYLYIRKYENMFVDIGFNFSSNYVADFKDNYLYVEKNETSIKNYYGKNVNNVVMFLGKNGVGKSTLLDLLGMTRDDRSADTYVGQGTKRKAKASYFIMYHLYEDYFGFEFVDNSFLATENKIKNIDMQYDTEKSALYKVPMGNIFELKKGCFIYCGNIVEQWLRNQKYQNKLKMAYITSDRYNSRITNRYRDYFDEYTFERKYYLEENYYEYLYKYLLHLRNINNELLLEKNITIKNSIKLEFYPYDRSNMSLQDFLEERRKELDKIFGFKRDIQVQIEKIVLGKKPQKETGSRKARFLYTFYVEAIEYYFLEQLVGWSKNSGIEINEDIAVPSIEDIEDKINILDDDEVKSIKSGHIKIRSFQQEYADLLYIIRINTDEKGNINLKSVLMYVLDRVERAAKSTVDIFDKNAIDKIIHWLEELPEKYFKNKREIVIDCSVDKENKILVELFKFYDLCIKIRNDDGGNNSISQILNIEMPKMSEGQRVFLDIISKCVSAIYSIKSGDSLVLLIDEPDRALHPELARKFLNTLLETINACQNSNIQIVLTSHSPFIVTDILPENVYAIDIQDGKRTIKNDKSTYATNIYYLLMDSFMLDSTLGEYSHNKLKDIAKVLSSSEKIEEKKLEEIKMIIDRIGEKTIKAKLLQLYRKHEELKMKLAEQLLRETDNDKIMKIKEILDKND